MSFLPGGLRQLLRRPPGGSGDLPDGAICERDLAYGDDPEQRLDVYLPGITPRGPLIVVVHGGAWAIGDKAGPRVIQNKVAHWLPKGFVVASVNYRMLPVAGPFEQSHDLAAALGYIQSHAPTWGADANQLVVMGHSTGAHLAALLAADPRLAVAHGAKPWRATVLLDSAALDVEHTMNGPHLPLHDRAFGNDPAYWREASPMHRLRECPSPMLLVHAAARADSAAQARRFAAAVLALGGRADVQGVPLSHADINGQLGQDPDYTAMVDGFFDSVGLR